MASNPQTHHPYNPRKLPVL